MADLRKKTQFRRKNSGKTVKTTKKMSKKRYSPKANRQYKDTVFRMLFSGKKNLLSLYNALNKTAYTNPELLRIVTLKNAVYMGIKNDLAFILQENLMLYEHQSTQNPNMPLRDLFYISSEYEKSINKKSLYSSTLQKIPTPRFVVFYNGTEDMEDCREYRLSDAYENPTEDPDLELRVQVLNINEGHNKELMEQCQMLKEYAQFVGCVRKYAEDGDLDTAMEKAVNECIEKNILREFLEENKAEVIRMSIFEYNREKEEKKLRRAEFEGGREVGLRTGLTQGRAEGRAEERTELLKVITYLRNGETVETISKTGIDEETIRMAVTALEGIL